MNTNRFAIRLSRDVMLCDGIVQADHQEDPYRETLYPVTITLPDGYEVAMSNGGTYEIYGPDGHGCDLVLCRTSRALPGWFRLRGRQRYVIRFADSRYYATLPTQVNV